MKAVAHGIVRGIMQAGAVNLAQEPVALEVLKSELLSWR